MTLDPLDALTTELVMPCGTCAPTHPMAVDRVHSVIRCTGCGHERPLILRALYLISGAPTTGKTGLVERLGGRLDKLPVFDTDLFGAAAHPEWAAWATSWLLIAHALACSGSSAVLCGYGLHRSSIEELPARQLIGPIHTLNLDLADDDLRARLQRRPGYDAARIERKVAMAAKLRTEAEVNVETSALSPDAIAAAAERWLRRHLG